MEIAVKSMETAAKTMETAVKSVKTTAEKSSLSNSNSRAPDPGEKKRSETVRPSKKIMSATKPKSTRNSRSDRYMMYKYYLAETALAIAPTILYEVINKIHGVSDTENSLKTVMSVMNGLREEMKQKPEELKSIYISNGQEEGGFPDLFHPVFKDEIKEILENKGNDTSTTTSDSKKENENAFYNAKIERIWTLSGLPTHITKEEKLSVKLRDETRTALNTYDHDKIRRVLHDKSEKLLAWYKSSRKDLSDLKNRIDTEITSPVSWVHLEVANRDSGGDREIRTG
jgi:hypothetical protein